MGAFKEKHERADNATEGQAGCVAVDTTLKQSTVPPFASHRTVGRCLKGIPRDGASGRSVARCGREWRRGWWWLVGWYVLSSSRVFFCVFAFSIFFLRIASSTLTHFLFFSTLHLQSLRVLSRRLESETCRNTIDQRDAVGTRAQ